MSRVLLCALWVCSALLPLSSFAQTVQLPQTGQTTCYESYASGAPAGQSGAPLADCTGAGQDGEHRAGVSWPDPRFTVTYCDVDGPCASQAVDCDANPSTDVITDLLTGLMWPRSGDVDGTSAAWQDSLLFAGGLVLCGQADWHMPNFNEMYTLVNSGVADSQAWLETEGFVDVAYSYWTSTTNLDRRYRAWFVELDDGTTYVWNKTSTLPVWPARITDNTVAARPVRTGQTLCYDSGGAEIDCTASGQDGDLQAGAAWPAPRFGDNGDGTVTDHLTGLIWLQDANCLETNYSATFPGGAANWQAALDAVAALNQGTYPLCQAGFSDWRLPNRVEMHSLTDFGTEAPALPGLHPFTNSPAYAPWAYWTSTSSGYVVDDPAFPYAWYVSTYDGMVDNVFKNWSDAWVWPVRGGTMPPGPTPDIQVTPASLEFGGQAIGGSSAAELVTIGNTGGEELGVSGIQLAGPDAADFALDLNAGAAPCGQADPVIAASDSCTVAVTFSPATVGTKAAVLRVTSDDPDEPTVEVALAGNLPLNVEFPDTNLEAAIRTVLALPTGDISRQALAGLTSLDASTLNIIDLSGLEYCESLEHLNLSGNAISDLSPLSGLVGLSYLNLYDNQISDVSPLSGLFTLVYLNLGMNQISDIATLVNLSNLTDLYLDDNQISTITALAFLSLLNNLALSNNNIATLADLVLNLGLATGDRLWLEGNPLDLGGTSQAVADIRTLQDRGAEVHHDPVGSLFGDANLEAAVRETLGVPDGILLPADLAALTELDASSRDIGDLSGIEYCTGLTSLLLHDNRLPEIAQLATLTGLTTLNLSINRIDRVTQLSGLTGLTWLNLSSNSITEIPPLANLTELTHLFLSNNLIVDISSLSGLENLTTLAISGNNIIDIEPLALNLGLGNGDTVWLTGNPLDLWYGSQTVIYIWALEASNVTVHHDPYTFFYDTGLGSAVAEQLEIPLAELTLEDLQALRVLDARNLGIADIRGVNLMLSLESLYLQGNQVSDLSPLSTLDNLQILNLEGNLVSNLMPLTTVTSLSQLTLAGNPVADISPLVANLGLGTGDLVWLRGPQLGTQLDFSAGSAATADIWSLRTRGVIVFHEPISEIFVDENLEAAVAETLGLTPSELTYSSLYDLEVLRADEREIVSLEGIEHCYNLWSLRLRGNRIADLTSLAEVDLLSYLDVRGNQVVDLWPLAASYDLEYLDISWNQVTDLGPLLVNSALGAGDAIRIEGNPLETWVGSDAVAHAYLLYGRGASVSHSPFQFRDPVLQQSLLEALGLSPRDITLATLTDMQTLEELNFSDAGITDITGLEYCRNLRSLFLYRNQIADISPVASLNLLARLGLDGNRVADLSPLAELVNLEDLFLRDNQLADLAPLANLQQLTLVALENNFVTDINPITTLPNLDYLDLRNNLVSDISRLPLLLNLTVLDVVNNPLRLWVGSDTVRHLRTIWERGVELHMNSLLFRDSGLNSAARAVLAMDPDLGFVTFADLGLLAMVTSLDTSDREVADLTGIEAFSSVTDLNLSNGSIRDISPLGTLEHLTQLNLTDNQVSDITPLVDHPGIDSGDDVWLSGNPLPTWEGTATLADIQVLQARGVTVHYDTNATGPFADPALESAVRTALGLEADVGFTETILAALTDLDLQQAGVSDLDGIQYCANLGTLNSRGNSIADGSPLRYLHGLTELNISLTQISDISPLAELEGLQTVNLYGNPVADWTPLSGMTNLRSLTFGGPDVAEINWLAGLTGLTELQVADSTLSSLTPLSDLTRLETLTWRDGAVIDLTPLQGLSALRNLTLDGNRIADLAPLADLSALEQLGLSGNEIIDLTPLENLTALDALALGFNLVEDLAPLVNNAGLGDGDVLDLAHNNLNMVVISDDVQNILALEARGAYVHHDPIIDFDGVTEREEQGPDGLTPDYDGNGDGSPDGQQANVASLHSQDGESYVTIDCNLPYTLDAVAATDSPAPPPAGVEFPVGFFQFGINDVPLGAPAEVHLTLPAGTTVTSYWKYGKTPDDANPHWYEFLYDGETGAEINGNVITLHFVNNGRGDDWLEQDTYIADPGAPAIGTPAATGGGGGGGCFVRSLVE